MENIPESEEELIEQLQDKSDNYSSSESVIQASEDDLEPELGWAYEPLRNLVKMVTGGYERFVMLEADGGIGKTYNVKKTLNQEIDRNEWTYQSGYTTPLELYKTLYKNRRKIIFFDDMSGITKKNKCVNLLKAALDTEGDENQVHWRSSQTPEDRQGNELPQMFYFTGSVIISFNDTPDNHHFEALKTRGQHYELDFTYDERIRILREVCKNGDMPLTYPERVDTVNWIEMVTEHRKSVTIRTLEKILNIRQFSQDQDKDWKKTALEVFNLDFEKELIIRLIKRHDSMVEAKDEFIEKTDSSEGYYYDKKQDIENNTGLLDNYL